MTFLKAFTTVDAKIIIRITCIKMLSKVLSYSDLAGIYIYIFTVLHIILIRILYTRYCLHLGYIFLLIASPYMEIYDVLNRLYIYYERRNMHHI